LEEFKKPVFKKVTLNLEVEHHEYLQSLEKGTANGAVRWMFDHYPGYQKFIKKKNEQGNNNSSDSS
jgi:hypothetical protein